jgi:hypothetical protein
MSKRRSADKIVDHMSNLKINEQVNFIADDCLQNAKSWYDVC